MGLPAYIATNLATSANITGSTISSSFPKANLVDTILGKYTKWTGGGGALKIHMTVNYDSMYIGNFSLVAAEYFRIAGNTTATPSAATDDVTVTTNQTDVFVSFASLSNYVANRAYIDIIFGTSADPVTIGEIVVGTRVAFPRNYKWEYPKKERGLGVTNTTRGGVRTVYPFAKYKVFQPQWEFPESELETFRTFNNAVYGAKFVWIPDVATAEGYYVRKDILDFDPTPIGPRRDAGVLQAHYSWAPLFCADPNGLIV